MCNDGPTIVVERYAPPDRKNAKAKGARPACVVALSFKTEKVFRAIIEKRMSDTVAVVSGRLKIYGDDKKLDLLEPLWEHMEAKLGEAGAGSEETKGGVDVEADDDSVDGADEEEAWESLTPLVEPRNPCTRRFWARHFGTDALACAWLWLVASVFYLWMILLHVRQSHHHNPPPPKLYNYYCKSTGASHVPPRTHTRTPAHPHTRTPAHPHTRTRTFAHAVSSSSNHHTATIRSAPSPSQANWRQLYFSCWARSGSLS